MCFGMTISCTSVWGGGGGGGAGLWSITVHSTQHTVQEIVQCLTRWQEMLQSLLATCWIQITFVAGFVASAIRFTSLLRELMKFSWLSYQGPLFTGLTIIVSWMNNHALFIWDAIFHPCHISMLMAVKEMAWMGNYITPFYVIVINYPWSSPNASIPYLCL